MPTGNNVAGGQTISNDEYKKRMAILNKTWDECTVEEKLEKVREELIQLGYNTNRVNNLEVEITKLKDHDHKDGKVVIALSNNALNGTGYLSGASRRNNLS